MGYSVIWPSWLIAKPGRVCLAWKHLRCDAYGGTYQTNASPMWPPPRCLNADYWCIYAVETWFDILGQRPGSCGDQWKSMAHVSTADHGLPTPVLSPANSTARVMEEHLLNQNTCLYSHHNSALLGQTCFEIIWVRQGICTTTVRQ